MKTFTGYASVFNMVDGQKDRILRGAFTRTLKERVTTGRGGNVRLLWQHQVDEPIGVFESIREDSYGLRIAGRLLPEVARAREAKSLMEAGALDGLSIGFVPVAAQTDPVSGIRTIHDLDLYEISLVTFPANELARVDPVRAHSHQNLLPALDFDPEDDRDPAWVAARHSGEIFRLNDALTRASDCLTG